MKQPTLKIMMLGEIGVGKTSIVRRLVFDTFEASYKATIGVDIYSYSLERVSGALDRDVSLLIWDIDGDLGEDIFHHIYMKGAHAACVVSDAMRITTQRTALGLMDGFTEHFPGRPAILVMNKVDLLTGEKAKTLSAAPAAGFQAIWTSAKTGSQVSEAFQILGQQCIQRGLER
jgi:small GTP-binding protein